MIATSNRINLQHKLRTIFDSWFEVICTQGIAKRKLFVLIHKKKIKNQENFFNRWNENIAHIKTVESKINNMKVRRNRIMKLNVIKQLRGDTDCKKLL